MSSTFIQFNFTKIGSVELSGPGVEGKTSLNDIFSAGLKSYRALF